MGTSAPPETLSESESGLADQSTLMKALLIAAIAASSLSMIFSIGTAFVSASQDPSVSVASVETALD